jgi:hypothetical protein
MAFGTENGIRLAKRIAIVGVFSLFIGQVIFDGIFSDDSVAPDESHHVLASMAWSKAIGFKIQDSDLYIGQGPLNQFPYLYHLVLGQWYRIKLGILGDYLWL